LGGDTWIVGCQIPNTIVYPEYNPSASCSADDRRASFSLPQIYDQFGLYQPHCGLQNVKFAFGHDEYMYRMLLYNQCSIPLEGLLVIRYHSCYVWHTHNEYQHLMTGYDAKIKELVQEFNKYDLYTKAEERINIDDIKEYYDQLIKKYLPNKLFW
jgi:inositol oxygenase